jgi:hypothetical protein
LVKIIIDIKYKLLYIWQINLYIFLFIFLNIFSPKIAIIMVSIRTNSIAKVINSFKAAKMHLGSFYLIENYLYLVKQRFPFKLYFLISFIQASYQLKC